VRRLDGALVIEPFRIKSGVKPPHSKDAVYFDFGFEVLQSSNLALVAAVLPLCSDLF
jgi:hypothetical protein